MKQKTFKRKAIKWLISFGVLAMIVLAAMQLTSIRHLTISGNEHYTKEELKDLIFADQLTHNSLYLYWLYNYGNPPAIPFVDTVEVELKKANSVSIKVYEKSVVGYVQYLDTCMYFDKDGIVVESSDEVISGVPMITGLNFNHILLHEKLPVEKQEVFDTILNLTQLMQKYQINPDKIYFDKAYDVTLYFGNARVELGQDEETEDKMLRLQAILPDLSGLSGVLHMENYADDETDITFVKDK